MREFGSRCTRCFKGGVGDLMIMLPIMGCMMMLCKECIPPLLKDGIIPPKAKGSVVKIKEKGGDK